MNIFDEHQDPIMRYEGLYRFAFECERLEYTWKEANAGRYDAFIINNFRSWHKLNEFHIFAEKTYGAQAKHFMSALRQQKPSKEWAQN